MLRVGVIGCGAVVHRNYARVLIGRDAYAVRHVYDIDPDRATEGARLFGAAITPPEQLVESVDAVVITTPPSSHAALIETCAKRGKTILCEKPFATNRAEAVTALAAAKAAGAQLYIGQFRRAFPHLALARRIVALGLIGDVAAFAASEGGRFSWEATSGYTVADPAGGVLWDTGSHTLDMALFAAGLDLWEDPAVAVDLVERDKTEPSHDFRARFSLMHEGAAVRGALHVSRRVALPNMIRIVGTEGELAFSVGLDDRVRLARKAAGSVVLTSEAYGNLLEGFDVEVRSVLLKDGDEVFAARNFLGQMKLLETLSTAEQVVA